MTPPGRKPPFAWSGELPRRWLKRHWRAMRATAVPTLAALLLAACATSTPPAGQPNEPPWTSGRLSVRIDATPSQGAQNVSVAFDLQAAGDRGELRLNSPLGTRVASARWAPGLAVLTDADGEHRYGSLDDLSRQALGEALPLAALPDWLAGRPWPGAAFQTHDAGFDQLGWQVLLARRGDGWIEARRTAAPAVLVRVKLDGPG